MDRTVCVVQAEISRLDVSNTVINSDVPSGRRLVFLMMLFTRHRGEVCEVSGGMITFTLSS